MEYLCFGLVLSFFVILWYFFTRNYDHFEKRGIPFRKPYLIFGNFLPTLVFNKRKAEWLMSLSKEFHSSSMYGIFHFHEPVYVTEDPEIIKQISIKEFNAFPNHIPPVHCKGDALLTNAMLALRDQKWKNMRTILSPAFTGKKIRVMFDVVNDSILDFIAYCTENCDTNGCLEINAVKLFERHAVDTTFLATSGLKSNALRNPNDEIYLNARKPRNIYSFVQQLKFFGTMFSPYLMKFFDISYTSPEVTKFFEKVLSDTIAHRKDVNIDRPDFIQLLMQAIHAQKCNGETPLTTLDVAAQSVDALIATMETVGATLGFICYELAIHPLIQQKLYTEVNEMQLQLNGDPITYDLLLKMEYLDAVISESLRKHTPSIVQDRICEETTKVTDSEGKTYLIEKGMPVWINVLGLHHNPKYFPNPDNFDPDRFVGENKQNIVPNSYIPFSLGPRSCIGMRLAQLHLRLQLYHLISKFSIEVGTKTIIPLKHAAIFMLCAANDIYVVLRKRNH